MAAQNSLDTISTETEPLEQAIYACLTNIFNTEEASLALKSWAHHASGTSSVFNGVNSYAREICNSLNKPEKHRELAKALNRALIIQYSPAAINKPSAQELREPAPKILNAAPPAEPALSGNGFLTFQLLILEVMKHLAAQDGATKSKAVAFLNEITETMPWSEIQQTQILTLINDGKLQPVRTYKLDQLKNFVKYLKAWMTDELGVNAANLIINQVTEDVATLEKAKDFSPKHFFTA